MDKLTKFLVSCRMTQMVSNQELLKLIQVINNSSGNVLAGLKYLQVVFGQGKFDKFLLLFRSIDLANVEALNFWDPMYPKQLRQIYNPPALLFYKGKKNLLLSNCLSIVGSRKASEYSFHCVAGLVPKIVDRYTVVSGLATGVDTWAHQVTLDHLGNTIAVIGSSLDVAYPNKNAKLQQRIASTGLLLSEYPPGSQIKPWHFPQRNRIIAGLSEKVIVTEAKLKSGALITAELALDSNREVLAVPGRIDSALSAGCNKLIQDGAIPLINFNEI